MHLVPVTGEIHSLKESKRHEQLFQQQQQVAMQQEQQKVKAALNGRKGINRKILGGR